MTIVSRAFLFAALPMSLVTQQGQPVLVNIHDLSSHELRSEGFALSAPQTLRIEAVGAAETRNEKVWIRNDRDPGFWRGNAWILDARTREVVWELRRADTKSGRRDLERFEGTLRLPAGQYEVYYASYSGLSGQNGGGWRWLIGTIRNDETGDHGMSDNFRLVVRGAGRPLTQPELQRLRDDYRSNAIVKLTTLRRAEYDQIGFELSKPTEVEIYALGEADGDSSFDYGWILNTDTREKVWTLQFRRSQAAGGARKNRRAHETRVLPAGRYAAVYALDDSHDPREWNAAPPYDPTFWGLTVRVKPEERANVSTFAYDPTPSDQAIVALTRMRDDETRTQGFTLTNGMNDYGWILDAATRRRVWVMEYERTEHAGGAEKNRLADQVLQLPAGSYIVYYQTDDSHAFRSWNSAPPVGADDWGISVFPLSGQLDKSAIAPFSESVAESTDVIAQLVNVGDEQQRSRTFSLANDTDVRVYALGEGMNGEMFDYAWIENARTGRVIWEMTYRMTAHAGGAQKNRLYDEVIRLPAGEYVLRYQSDGSHSKDGWNADPPFDPAKWGATLFHVLKK
jgi:hypothetical protein